MNYSKFYNEHVLEEFKNLSLENKEKLRNPLKYKRAGTKSETSPLELNSRLTEFCTSEGGDAKRLYLEFEHILADLAKTRLKFNDNGTVDLADTWKGLSDTDKGKLLVTVCSRSVTSTQSTAKQQYGVLVPMYFAAHKKYNNIPYSKFITQENIPFMSLFVEYKVAMMLQYFLEKGTEGYPIPSPSIHERRVAAFNGYDPSASNHIVYYPVNAGFDIKTPQLAIHLMLQTWAANPAYWVDKEIPSKYALLNPLDWDSLPDPQWGEMSKSASKDTPW